ncbi:MAG: prolyl oligopeptidase family serine peptidase [Planctomycetota bacterium]
MIELDDLNCVIDWCLEEAQYKRFHVNPDQLYLLGHSRGAAIAILKASEDDRIKKIATWAPVHDPERFFGDDKTLAYWKQTGVLYVENMRTRQQMPLYWQFYENYLKHRDRLHLPTRVRDLKIPFFIAHGTQDDTIPYVASLELHSWIPHAKFFCVEEGGHTFGGHHPWPESSIPEDCIKVVQATTAFFRENH